MALSIQGQTVTSVVNNNYQYVSSVVGSSNRYVDLDRENELVVTWNIRKVNLTTGKIEAVDFFGNDIPDMIESGILLPIGASIGGTIWTTPPSSMWEAYARLREYSFEPLEGGSVNVTCRFTTLYVPEPVMNPVTNVTELMLPASVEMTTTNRSMVMYLSGDTLTPPDPLTDNTEITDSATLASNAAHGIPVDVPQVRIRMRIVQDCNNDNSTFVDKITDLKAYIGKRNSASFLNFDIGTIYCEGLSLQPIDHEFYEVVFDFVYDFYYEFVQVPNTDGDGNPKTQIDVVTGELFITDVWWRRQHRESVDFYDIFGSNTTLQQYIEQGWWTGIP